MLNEDQLRAFTRDGFLTVRALYTPEEIHDVSAWTDEISAWTETPGKWMMYFEQSSLNPGERILCRMEDFEPYHAGFRRLINDERMKGCVSQLIGEPAVLFKDKINFKLPGGDGFKAHQDVQAGWDAYAPLHITALLSIDACTTENGCLEVAAACHDRGLIGEKWAPLDEDALDYRSIPTSPGDAIFFDSFAPHRSGPNHTSTARRVLYVTYNRLSDGDRRRRYYDDKRRSYPPDCERDPGREYVFRV